MDDETGWDEVLTGVWGPHVRDAVVVRVERVTVGARCLLVRTLGEPEGDRSAWVEQLHRLVLDAIRAETGADLEELGSQAAWASYEQVWETLAARWRDGGTLATVPLRREVEATRQLERLSPTAAQAAGMDVGVDPPQPLWLAGRLRVDREGLETALELPTLDPVDRAAVGRLLQLLAP